MRSRDGIRGLEFGVKHDEWQIFRKFATYSGKHLKAHEIGAARRVREARRVASARELLADESRKELDIKESEEKEETRRKPKGHMKDNCRPTCSFRYVWQCLSSLVVRENLAVPLFNTFRVSCSFYFHVPEDSRSSELCCYTRTLPSERVY